MNSHTKAEVAPIHDPIAINPFLKLIGARMDEACDGKSRFTIDMTEELLNLHNAVHGGVIMTLLDAAMANAAVSKTGFTTTVVTVNMSINFVRPGFGKLTILAHVSGGGQSISLCQADVLDENGDLVAQSHGTFKHRKKKTEGAVE